MTIANKTEIALAIGETILNLAKLAFAAITKKTKNIFEDIKTLWREGVADEEEDICKKFKPVETLVDVTELIRKEKKERRRYRSLWSTFFCQFPNSF